MILYPLLSEVKICDKYCYSVLIKVEERVEQLFNNGNVENKFYFICICNTQHSEMSCMLKHSTT